MVVIMCGLLKCVQAELNPCRLNPRSAPIRSPCRSNGEIVPDNDPRAIARRNPKPAPSTAPGQSNVRNLHGGGGGGAGRGGSGMPRMGGAGGAGPGPLDQVAEALGIRGQTVEIPAIWRLPARQVQLIHIVILALLALFFGWHILAVAAVLHVFSGLSEQQAAAAGRPAAAGGAPPG